MPGGARAAQAVAADSGGAVTSRGAWWPAPPSPTRPRTREEIEAAVERLCDTGCTDHEMAAQLHLSVVYVRRILAARNARTPA
jgi:hypothetical protein